MGRHRYQNLDPRHVPQAFGNVFRWAVWDRLTGRRKIAPPGPGAPGAAPDLEDLTRPTGSNRLLWLGHAGFLGNLGGACFAIDPVLSPRIGGAYRRHCPIPLRPGDLPKLTALLISHNHYDHLDAATVLALPRDVPICVPLDLGAWFRRRGFRTVTELDWWQAVTVEPLRITLVPARHWSRRTPWDTNLSLWGGFVVEAVGRSIYHAGDTALFETFEEIGRRFPDLDAALLPIGAYAPPWFMDSNHMNPEQAGEAFLTLGARRLVPMHWGAYQLTDEPVCEPIQRLETWFRSRPELPADRLVRLAVGQSLELR